MFTYKLEEESTIQFRERKGNFNLFQEIDIAATIGWKGSYIHSWHSLVTFIFESINLI